MAILTSKDKDGLVLGGAKEIRVPSLAGINVCYLEVLVQRDIGRVTRYFVGEWEGIYDQCHKLRNVVMYMVNRNEYN